MMKCTLNLRMCQLSEMYTFMQWMHFFKFSGAHLTMYDLIKCDV